MHDLTIIYQPIDALVPYERNARNHPKKQIKRIAASMRELGFRVPVLVDADNVIIAGHGRLQAARSLGIDRVPTVRLEGLTPEQARVLRLADNKLALEAEWDLELVAEELRGLLDLQVDIDLTGFCLAEVDLVLDRAREADPDERGPEDDAPVPATVAVTRPGEIWILGRHRLLCGDAREAADHERLMEGERADVVFTDPPYNVPIDGHVSGLGAVHHREFAMAVGEMSAAQFIAFLTVALGHVAVMCRDGAIVFVCMDWRHMAELLAAGKAVFAELKNVCVWNKSNAGMGTFYRSKHELVCVFKVGEAPHTNTFGLGEKGRYRTNVWDYPGVSSFGAGRDEALAMHPTVKPVALVADAIRDCSKRGQIVLDPFGGSGSTLIAAEVCGRRARLIEYDPLYCDTIVRRWERYTGKRATLAGTDQTFEVIEEARVGGMAHV